MPLRVEMTYHLTCSRPACTTELSGDDAGDVIRTAREQGWMVSWDNRPDLCPDHAPESDDDPFKPAYQLMIDNLDGESVRITPGTDLYLVSKSGKQIPGFVFEWAYYREGAIRLVVLDQHKRRMEWEADAMRAVLPSS